MSRHNAVPCDCCQKAFHRHSTLAYLYCGHNRVIVFREPAGPARFVPVQSTDEAIRIIQLRDSPVATLARTA
ncbi:MAG TPA: hypothetical protein VM011_02125 [Gammaproteobacteria bacterium]|nr:hypothetical protein [Gammaproteobacteria bacterium]